MASKPPTAALDFAAALDTVNAGSKAVIATALAQLSARHDRFAHVVATLRFREDDVQVRLRASDAVAFDAAARDLVSRSHVARLFLSQEGGLSDGDDAAIEEETALCYALGLCAPVLALRVAAGTETAAAIATLRESAAQVGVVLEERDLVVSNSDATFGDDAATIAAPAPAPAPAPRDVASVSAEEGDLITSALELVPQHPPFRIVVDDTGTVTAFVQRPDEPRVALALYGLLLPRRALPAAAGRIVPWSSVALHRGPIETTHSRPSRYTSQRRMDVAPEPASGSDAASDVMLQLSSSFHVATMAAPLVVAPNA